MNGEFVKPILCSAVIANRTICKQSVNACSGLSGFKVTFIFAVVRSQGCFTTQTDHGLDCKLHQTANARCCDSDRPHMIAGYLRK
jgi:hypothetical protein